jgi:uncharacterized membrane protein YgcG
MSSIDYSKNYQLIDKDHILSPEEYKRLEQSIADMTRDLYQEFIVCFVRSVPSRNFREHAVALRRELSKDVNSSSIILVVSADDRHAEIATAPRFARLFTPRASSALLKNALAPLMKQGKTVEAVTSTLREVCNLLQKKKSRALKIASTVTKYFLIAVILVLLGWIGYIHVKAHLCIECGHWVRIETTVLKEATYSSTGLEEITYICNHCGTHYKKTVIILEKSSSGSSSSDSWSNSSSDSSSDGSSDSVGCSDGGGGADW